MPSATDTGTLSYAQLKAVWMDASRGTRYHTNAWASLMAAIAEAESGGQVLVTNPNDNNGTQTSWGLWQISNGTHNAPDPNWGDPSVNARLAIAKLNNSPSIDNRVGPGGIVAGLGAWGTYDSGAYRPYISDKSAPDYTLTNAPSHVQQAQVTAAAEGEKSCAWQIGWGGIAGTSWLNWLGGGSGNVGSGEVCLISKSQFRHILGAGLLIVGAVGMFLGASWIIKAAVSAELAAKLAPVLGALGPEGAAAGAAVTASAPKPRRQRPNRAATQEELTTAS